LNPSESPEDANRVLEERTGLKNVYMEQFRVFGKPDRDPVERTISCSLFCPDRYSAIRTTVKWRKHNPEWFLLGEMPEMVFDHAEMVKAGQKAVAL
jgi:8-oxo-dGTP diphosphatase